MFRKRKSQKESSSEKEPNYRRKITVPDYIYSTRVRDDLVPYFENQYFKRVERYDNDLGDDPDKKLMAKRIGYRYLRGLGKQVQSNRLVPAEDVQEFGDDKFSWRFLKNRLHEDSHVFCFGVGTNISFEIELTRAFGCVVYCFDPTPHAIEYAVPVARGNSLIKFYPYGVLSRDTLMKFYKPTDAGLRSLSVENLGYGGVYIEAPVLRLPTLMHQFGASRLDLLKIDIEGAEYDVIEDMLFSGLEVDQLCVEFDQPMPPWRTEKAIAKLYLGGYHLVDVQALNCLFVHERLLSESIVAGHVE